MLWINGHGISEADVPSDAADMKPYVIDDVVRAFRDWAEARTFKDGRTDHVGNLPGPKEHGTWVRFQETHLNIVGEDHTYVTLDQVTKAVGSANFTYEPFATDVLPETSAFRAAYLEENRARLEGFGVSLTGDLTLVGGESLLPKIADTVAELVPYFNKTLRMRHLTSNPGCYLGQPDQRYVKIGWAWAKDLAAKVNRTPTEDRLLEAVETHRSILEPFITSLPVDGYLGDPLIKDEHEDKYKPLLELCVAYVPVMIERAHADPGITGEEQQTLRRMPTNTTEEQQDMFGLWRNQYFAKAVESAARRGVRYAGMGDNHRKWLESVGRVPRNALAYSVTPALFESTLKTHGWLRLS
jgi:hypothetical protein